MDKQTRIEFLRTLIHCKHIIQNGISARIIRIKDSGDFDPFDSYDEAITALSYEYEEQGKFLKAHQAELYALEANNTQEVDSEIQNN